jgi:LmbE family N-acetylglucosaminyl deacetylase
MKTLFISPHPDDETLGCGGTIFKHGSQGDELYWLNITGISEKMGFSKERVQAREQEINEISKKFRFSRHINLQLPTTKLDSLPMGELIEKISEVYKEIEPQVIYTPYIYDVHTDHNIIAKALNSTIKWFRHPYIKKVLSYETTSETEFNFLEGKRFKPNVYINISNHLNQKIEAMKIYKSEVGDFPFPRSEKTIRSLAYLRGSQSGFEAAEAFQLAYERQF